MYFFFNYTIYGLTKQFICTSKTIHLLYKSLIRLLCAHSNRSVDTDPSVEQPILTPFPLLGGHIRTLFPLLSSHMGTLSICWPNTFSIHLLSGSIGTLINS